MGENTTLSAKSPAVEVTAEVIFGKLSQDCRGIGICKVDTRGHRAASQCPHCTQRAQVHLSCIDGHTLLFRFERSSISNYVRMKQFRHLEFIVPEAFHFNEHMLTQLNMKKLCIRAGVYPVQETSDGYEIKFSLQKKEANMPTVSYMIRRKRAYIQPVMAPA